MIGNTKIVIADDMEPILLYLEKVISEYKEIEIVGKAKNGNELVDLVLKEHPDVVITDVQMPECSGIEAVEKLNVLGVNTKYIFITGNENAINTCDLKKLGILATIRKPITDDKIIIQKIKEVIEINTDEKILENNKENEKRIIDRNIQKTKRPNIIMRIINKKIKSK